MNNIILNIIKQTSYNQLYYPKIIKFLSNNFSSNSKTKIYLINRSILNERIFVVKFDLPVNYNNKINNVSLLIYFPSNFPFDIEFYFEKTKNLVINNNYSNEIINRNSLRINLDYFCNWDSDKLNFSEIIETLKYNFNESFPILINNNSKENYGGSCILENNNIIQEIYFGNNNNNFNNQIDNNVIKINNINYNNNKIINQSFKNNNNFKNNYDNNNNNKLNTEYNNNINYFNQNNYYNITI